MLNKNLNFMKKNVDVVFGLQWGDEGKGKIVDYLTPNYDVVARFQGGANAGHTIKVGHTPYVLHIIPSGIFHYNVMNFIGNGVVIDPVILQGEIDGLINVLQINPYGNLFISHKANLILPTHRMLDAAYESTKGAVKIGSTLKGIGPTYTDKIARRGLRICDIKTTDFRAKYEELKAQHLRIAESLGYDIKSFKIGKDDLHWFEKKWFDAINEIKKVTIVNGEYWLNELLDNGKKVLAEGAQGTMLDIDFGTYPFVTSSSTTIGGVCTGLGIPASAINRVYGITKAYCTRVGEGPFPTELFDKTGELLQKKGQEFGATTGRPRRCGWLDLVQLKYACMINGVTDIIITKADILNDFKEIRVCMAHEIACKTTKRLTDDLSKVNPIYKTIPWSKITNDIPNDLNTLIDLINNYTAPAKVTYVSTGPGRDDMFKI